MIAQLSFNVEAAKIHGVEGAVLLSHIVYWVCRNKANKKNEIDGITWTYNSARSFQELFPFWNASKIRRLLQKLEKENAIIIGCYNRAKYDRTKWFALHEQTLRLYKLDSSKLNNAISKNEECIMQNDKMHCAEVDKQYQITTQITNQNTNSKKIVYPFDGDVFLETWNLWKQYKKEEKGFKFKSSISEQMSLNDLKKLSNNNEHEAIELIKFAISKGWSGIHPKKGSNKTKKDFNNEKYLAHLESL